MQLACQQRSPRPATRTTRSRPMRAPARAAATISTTGSSATTSASAPARTASSADRARRAAIVRTCGRASRDATGEPRESGARATARDRRHGDRGARAPRSAGCRAAVRVHDECAAAERGLRGARCSRRAPACGSQSSSRARCSALRRGLLRRARGNALARDRAGLRVSERSAGANSCRPAAVGGLACNGRCGAARRLCTARRERRYTN